MIKEQMNAMRLTIAKVVCTFLLVFAHGVLVTEVAAEAGGMLVFYPETREPYAGIYRDFITGIRQSYQGEVKERAVNNDLSDPVFRQLIAEEQPDFLVSLGNSTLSGLSELVLRQGISIPVYAITTRKIVADNVAKQIILRPSADAYLDVLASMTHDTKNMYVLFNPLIHGDLLGGVSERVNHEEVKLTLFPVKTFRESAKAVRSILAVAKRGDAFWVVADRQIIDKSLLRLILDKSWDSKVAVFSTNPAFVKRGALFALYPDNVAVGVRLGAMIETEDQSLPIYQTLRDFRVTYNERTGKHIGIKSLKTLHPVEILGRK